MSEVINNMKTRRSIRKYKPDMIPEDVLNRIIEAGTYAATGMGKQSPIIIAVTNKEIRDKFSKMNAEIMGVDSDPFYGAPVVLIVLACLLLMQKALAAAGFTEPKRNLNPQKARPS